MCDGAVHHPQECVGQIRIQQEVGEHFDSAMCDIRGARAREYVVTHAACVCARSKNLHSFTECS